MISLESKFTRDDDIAWRVIDGEALVVSPRDSLVYPLNGVATRIWELFDGKKTVSDITSIICDEFDADEMTIRNDIIDFIKDLSKAELIKELS